MTRRERDGSTPLVEIDRLDELPGVDPPDSGTRLLAKLESVHPGGSIKDRPVRRILESAVARGDLRGRRVLDSSSGNAGIAYASIGAALGLDVTLVVPGNASAERLERIRAHGAELVVTDPFEGYDHAVHTARTMAASESETYWHADQYGNDDNWRAHYEGTGRERSTQESVDAILEGMSWLGLDADEGPFFQTQRFDRYKEVLDDWLEQGHAYYCYCTREELDELREAQRAAGLKPRYAGRWRDRTAPRDGVDPVIRFRNPL